MAKKILVTAIMALSCPLPIIAGTMGELKLTSPLPEFYVGAFGGYGTVDGAHEQDGNVAEARLAFGIHAKQYKNIFFGAELGIQSGNTMRLHAPAEVIDIAGGLPIQSTLKPFIDGLVTAKYQFRPTFPLFAIVKGGIAYRQLVLENRNSSKDSLNKVNGEFQGGFGYNLTNHLLLTFLYQGIYSQKNAGIHLNSAGDFTISHIPTQQAGFLGMEYSFS